MVEIVTAAKRKMQVLVASESPDCNFTLPCQVQRLVKELCQIS